MKDNTIIFSMRDREENRVKNLLKSIKSNNINSSVLLLDFGSFKSYKIRYESLCNEYHINYLRTETEGLPWSRAQALNTGIKASSTNFVTTTDADMIFEKNPFDFIGSQEGFENNIYYVMSYWLPKNGKKQKASCAGEGSSGGFQFISKKNVEILGGYDERICFWGLEDRDWTHRIELTGLKQYWLPEQYKMYHQWHKPAEGRFFRPQTARYDSMRRFHDNTSNPCLSQNFGKIRTKADRPILELVQENKLTGKAKPFIKNLNRDDFDAIFPADEILGNHSKEKFQQINLNTRFYPTKIKYSLANKIFKPFTKITKTELLPILNYNFDFIYNILPVYFENGLIDYYITKELETIYLLWDK